MIRLSIIPRQTCPPWYYFGEDRDPFSYTTRDPYRLSDAFNYDDVSQMLAASPDRDKFLPSVKYNWHKIKNGFAIRLQVIMLAQRRLLMPFKPSDRIQRAGAFVKSEGYPVRIYERITSLKAELAASPSDESVGKITDSIIDLLNVEKQDFEYVLRWEIFSMLQQPNVKEALNEIFNNDAFLPFKQRLVKSLLCDTSFIKPKIYLKTILPRNLKRRWLQISCFPTVLNPWSEVLFYVRRIINIARFLSF